MISFLPGSAALAAVGLAAAAAPVVIHLLNRRRFRVLDWAAMDFLLAASQRSRRLLECRDFLVLAVRAAAVACFGLAVARPLFTAGGGMATTGPVHAVVVVDNSLSMGRERLGGRTLLDDARGRVRDFIDRLPPGSRTSVVPLCGPAGSFTLDPHRTADDAAEALQAIRVVDRAGSAATAVELALQAAAQVPDLPAKRLLFIGDQQAITWPASAAGLGDTIAGSGADSAGRNVMQVVAVRHGESDNSWVESFRLDDGVGEVGTPARFTAVIRHEGATPRRGVMVTLSIDGVEGGDQAVDLEPGQACEVVFDHEFDAVPEVGRPALVAAQVSLTSDSLPGDDSRCAVVPVVTDVPVVFVDERGAAGERPRDGVWGETHCVRRLLASGIAREEGGPRPFDVRHVRIEELDATLLAGARLVVIAGVRSPELMVPPLHDFVAAGGRLVVAAGGEFEADSWNQAAWLDGAGILPLLLADKVGALPDESRELQPFALDWRSMRDDPLFRLPGVAEDELVDLYAAPVFFKAVACGTSPPSAGTLGGAEPARVLAAFDNGTPFIVSRSIGAGRVVWIGSGLSDGWNTLARTNAMLLFDRLLRSLLAETFPAPTVDTVEERTLPLPAEDRRATVRLTRPDGDSESLSVEALDDEAIGVTVRDMSRRGIYRVTVSRPDLADRERREAVAWTQTLAANGPASESQPALLDAAGFSALVGGSDAFRWVDAAAPIDVDGATVSGQGMWWWLLLTAFGCLVTESAVLGRAAARMGGAG